MSVETVEHNGILYAQIIWADTRVKTTTFFSPAESSFQFGLLAHETGFVEAPHYHTEFHRSIDDLQQMIVVQKGIIAIGLFDRNVNLIREVIMNPGDAIVLIHGIHSVRVIEEMQCISVKQGPFLGPEKDKIFTTPGA